MTIKNITATIANNVSGLTESAETSSKPDSFDFAIVKNEQVLKINNTTILKIFTKNLLNNQ